MASSSHPTTHLLSRHSNSCSRAILQMSMTTLTLPKMGRSMILKSSNSYERHQTRLTNRREPNICSSSSAIRVVSELIIISRQQIKVTTAARKSRPHNSNHKTINRVKTRTNYSSSNRHAKNSKIENYRRSCLRALDRIKYVRAAINKQ